MSRHPDESRYLARTADSTPLGNLVRYPSPMPSVAARTGRGARSAVAALITVAFVLPFVILVSGSLRSTGVPPVAAPALVPRDATLDNYVSLLEGGSFERAVLNSLLVAAVAVPLGVVVASWAGFAAARLPRRAGIAVALAAVAAASIPSSATFVGRLAAFRWLGITDTPLPLIAPALIGVSPLLVLLFAWSYATLPPSLYDVARGSGLGPMATWWRVALPLRRDVAGIAAAVAFVVTWGDFVDPLVYVYDERWYTLPMALASLAALPPTDQPVMLAAAVVAVLPVVLVFVLASRRLLRSERP